MLCINSFRNILINIMNDTRDWPQRHDCLGFLHESTTMR